MANGDQQLSIDDFRRVEQKVDKLTDAVSKLILFEERQTNQGERLGAAEARLSGHEQMIARVDAKVERWVNRGIGVWAVAAVLFAVMQFGAKIIAKM